MSRAHKFHNPKGIYFVSFATVEWMDVFSRSCYSETFLEAIKKFQAEKGLVLYAYVIMTNHVHLIFRAEHGNPGQLLGQLKESTSKKIRKQIEFNKRESRQAWMLRLMSAAGAQNSNVKYYQFWQQHNRPVELFSSAVKHQKLKYIHQNPVRAGYVYKPEDWIWSSARAYIREPSEIQVEFLV